MNRCCCRFLRREKYSEEYTKDRVCQEHRDFKR